MKILKILFHSPFFKLRMRKNDAFLVPSKVIKISTQKTDFGWFIDSLTTDKVREKILLSRGGEGRSSVSRASGTRRHIEGACSVYFAPSQGTICDSNADEFRQGTNRMTFTLFPTDIDVIRSENGWSLFLRKSLEG